MMMSEYPGYWMNEVSGTLRPAVERYLRNETLTDADIAALRAYFRQWIMAPVWDKNPHETDSATLARLRALIGELTTKAAISHWLAAAVDYGIDPL